MPNGFMAGSHHNLMELDLSDTFGPKIFAYRVQKIVKGFICKYVLLHERSHVLRRGLSRKFRFPLECMKLRTREGNFM